MPANSGLDPVAATAINSIVQPDLMINVTALLADAIDVIGPNAQPAAAASEATAPTPNDGGEHDSYGALGPSAGTSGLESNCGTELQQSLQTGGEGSESSGRRSSSSIAEGRVRQGGRRRPVGPGAERRSD